MRATHGKFGDVEIKYNTQTDAILSPDKKQKLLPCDGGCGEVVWVALNVVSSLCDSCVQRDYLDDMEMNLL